jgi:hypothetical protein
MNNCRAGPRIWDELVPVFQITPSAGLGFDTGLGIKDFFS